MQNYNQFVLIVIALVVLVPTLQLTDSRASSELPAKWNTLDGSPTTLYAHRGEGVLLPEHTLPSYEMAAALGADFIEADLVMTKDGVLVCHHDVVLKDSTDVEAHPEFAHLRRSFAGLIGEDFINSTTEWFVTDFTLAELKTLRVRQLASKRSRPQSMNNFFQIPTYEEYLKFICDLNERLNKTIGIVPEVVAPKFHNSLEGRPARFMEDQFLWVTAENGYDLGLKTRAPCPSEGRQPTLRCPGAVMLQCFELDALEYIMSKAKSPNLKTVLLVYQEVHHLTPEGLKKVAASNITEISIWKEFIFVGTAVEGKHLNATLYFTYNAPEVEELGGFIPGWELVDEAHQLGLRLSIYTLFDSKEGLQRGCALVLGCFPDDKREEMDYYFNMGVDGMFVENMAESFTIWQFYNASRPRPTLDSLKLLH